MPLNFKETFHFCSPDGVHAITLKPNEPRIVSPVMAAEFATHVAKGAVNGEIHGNTITMHSNVTLIESELEDEVETEPAPVEVPPLPELPVVDKEGLTRPEVVKAAVQAILDSGSPSFLTGTNEPRMSAVRKVAFLDTTVEERDAALEAIHSHVE